MSDSKTSMPFDGEKARERDFFLQGAYKVSIQIRSEFINNPAAFKNEKADDVKLLLDYIDKMERNEKIPENLSVTYNKIRDEIFKFYDKPEITETRRAMLTDYIERYEKASLYGKPNIGRELTHSNDREGGQKKSSLAEKLNVARNLLESQNRSSTRDVSKDIGGR
jgi:hypothetical protein